MILSCLLMVKRKEAQERRERRKEVFFEIKGTKIVFELGII